MNLIKYSMCLGLMMGCLSGVEAGTPPNIILMMADDLGYGDTGFNGNTIIKTPHMDSLAKRGVKLTHFYSGNSVCSPTRATCLTGRHHDRFGIFGANQAHLPAQEITLARMLKSKGYTTGHFGKWHLGTLSKTMSAKGEKRHPELNFASPWERDYDRSFVVESAITTWNPGIGKRAKNNPFYDDGIPVDPNDESLLGGAVRVVVDRAVPFIEQAVADEKPFLAVVWFNAPHEDIEAGPDYLKMYEGHGEAAHFYGCITELDEQVGRIFQTLEKTGAADNTLIFFCSDNGPEGKKASGRRMGTTDGLRGRKRALYDGGVRVPAFAVWPKVIRPGTESDAVLSTLDYFPTIGKLVGYKMPDTRPLDGQNMLPQLTGKTIDRDRAIPFRYANGSSSLVEGNFKLIMPEGELYDLSKDRAEEKDVSSQFPERVENMKSELIAFFQSVEKSHAGGDYNDSAYTPVNKWKPMKLEAKKSRGKIQ